MYWCAPPSMVEQVVDGLAADNFVTTDVPTWVESQGLGCKKRLVAYDRARLDHGLELVAGVSLTADDEIFDGTSDILQASHALTYAHCRFGGSISNFEGRRFSLTKRFAVAIVSIPGIHIKKSQ